MCSTHSPKLDKDVVNPSQIRAVIRTFKEALHTTLFPYRKEVPKTLIFLPKQTVMQTILFRSSGKNSAKGTIFAERSLTARKIRKPFSARSGMTTTHV